MLLVALALYAAAARIDTQTNRIGPDVWPKAIIVFMGLLCVYEIGKRLLFDAAPDPAPTATPGSAPEAADADGLAEPEAPVHWRMLIGGALLIGAFVAAVSWLGFFISTVLFISGFAWVGGFRRPLWVAVLGLGGSLLTMLLFMRLAYISLPLGEGPFRSLSIALLRVLGVT
jgi:putative tricarboxylic transport membrane protein